LPNRRTRTGLLLVFLCCLAEPAAAQGTTAPAAQKPDDTPSIRVGATLFTNFGYQTEPKVADADGNLVHKSSFEVTRSYINITGNISDIVAFRITPDIKRETDTASALAGSLELRIKYAFMQTNLDDWMTPGTYARFGIQQTPYLDYIEAIYRYRFQGTMFAERENYFASADAGVSFHYNLPSNYGDIHTGFFNGENYDKAEPNDKKAFMTRATVRPFAAGAPILRGLRATVFYDADYYLKNAERNRFMFNATFEHPCVVAGFEYLNAEDRTSARPATSSIASNGYSIWFTPKSKIGWEGLIRHDHLTPNTSTALISPIPEILGTLNSQKRNRTILGVAYWFPHQGNVSSALMLDYDGQSFEHISATPTTVVAVHALINF
jgi:hypothetical protein